MRIAKRLEGDLLTVSNPWARLLHEDTKVGSQRQSKKEKGNQIIDMIKKTKADHRQYMERGARQLLRMVLVLARI